MKGESRGASVQDRPRWFGFRTAGKLFRSVALQAEGLFKVRTRLICVTQSPGLVCQIGVSH